MIRTSARLAARLKRSPSSETIDLDAIESSPNSDSGEVRPGLVILRKRKFSADEDESDEESGHLDDIEFPVHDSLTNYDDILQSYFNYNEQEEEYPSHAAYDDELQSIHSDHRNLIVSVSQLLDGVTCPNNSISHVRDQVTENLSAPLTDPLTIGLLGDTGQGKSTLLNALTDIPGLAKAFDAGEACTYVPTVYRAAAATQQEPYAATITLFDRERISQMLSDFVNDFQTFYTADSSDHSDEEMQEMEAKAESAESTLHILFCGLPKMATPELVREQLCALCDTEQSSDEMLAEMLAELLATLMIHIDQFLSTLPVVEGSSVMEITAQDAQELWERMDPFLRNEDPDGKCSVWPLVKQVDVCLHGCRVLDYVILVDMPGLSDTNRTRVDATEAFIRDCDHLWIVAPAGRVTNNASVSALLKTYGRAFQGNVTVICSKSDENVSHATAKELQRRKFLGNNYDLMKASSENVQWQIKLLMKERRKSRRNLQYQDIKERIDKLTKIKMQYDDLCWTAVVEARNEANCVSLTKSYQRRVPSGKPLRVFSTSSRHYLALKERERCEKFQLSPLATGIPALRHHIYTLAADRVYAGYENYIEGPCEVLLQGLQLWAESSEVKGSATVRDLTNLLQSELRSILDDSKGSSCTTFDEYIIDPLSERQEERIESAQKFVKNVLSCAHWCTIKAHTRRNGKFKTSYNELLTQASTDFLNGSWKEYTDAHQDLEEELSDSMVEEMKGLVSSIKDDPVSVSLPIKACTDLVEGRASIMRQLLAASGVKLGKQLRSIFLEATTDGPGNYFAQAYQSTYEDCASDSGPGWKARTISRIGFSLADSGDKSPFRCMDKSMTQDATAMIEEENKFMQQEIGGVIALLHKDFELLFRKKAKNKAESRVRRDVAQLLKEILPQREKNFARLAALRQKYATAMELFVPK